MGCQKSSNLGRGLLRHLNLCGGHHISTCKCFRNDRATYAHEVRRLWRSMEASALPVETSGKEVGGELEGEAHIPIKLEP
jgi:hypothetical protein